jgi:hypothetical protein
VGLGQDYGPYDYGPPAAAEAVLDGAGPPPALVPASFQTQTCVERRYSWDDYFGGYEVRRVYYPC